MIRGVHTMFYTSDAEGLRAFLRAFLRDKLGFPAKDAGGGWLLMDLPPADMGCHSEKGVEFTSGVEDRGYGLGALFKMPGDFEVELYQPRHPLRWSA